MSAGAPSVAPSRAVLAALRSAPLRAALRFSAAVVVQAPARTAKFDPAPTT
ncbi:MAG: hypothetical protein IPQ14_01705 [Candidatus Microthrix sp.]|uniref:hypothetical protein n=1 Tax=Candidatus Neomicrothrix sp. TaxID=2719034 RepID=UPI0025B7B4E3|nr:hypothetical protein [Candidatus Microthrix sp.]MBL0203063.1 hypothetical protein [Candidatus Microthrix sp.]